MDISNSVFNAGQVYVALSRVTFREGILMNRYENGISDLNIRVFTVRQGLGARSKIENRELRIKIYERAWKDANSCFFEGQAWKHDPSSPSALISLGTRSAIRERYDAIPQTCASRSFSGQET
ncbi:hypothetical protein P5V15_002663 [Pogonomyrmex californicus]